MITNHEEPSVVKISEDDRLIVFLAIFNKSSPLPLSVRYIHYYPSLSYYDYVIR